MPTNNWRVALAAAKRLVLRFPGVTGVDYGYKYEAGRRSARTCVRFHVSSKKPLDALRAHEVLPTDLGSIACDVLQARYAPHAASQAHSSQMIRPGISIGNAARRSAGTLGAIVREAGSGRLCLLSNWHVLCGGSRGAARRIHFPARPAKSGARPGNPGRVSGTLARPEAGLRRRHRGSFRRVEP